MEVNIRHLMSFNSDLVTRLKYHPKDFLSLFEQVAEEQLHRISASIISMKMQVTFISDERPQLMRKLAEAKTNTLIKINGIILSVGKARPTATEISFSCSKCGKTRTINTSLGAIKIPKCDNGICNGTNIIMASKCQYIDTQLLKLQENPEDVPPGETPRNILLMVDRYLINRVTPGTRVSVMGILSLLDSSTKRMEESSSIRTPFLKVVNIEVENNGINRSHIYFTETEEREMTKMAQDPKIYEKLVRSIAPQISGEYTEDIKKALLCQLLGGTRKVLPDGVKLRGDINILLMGDPSTAKSQLLKFIEKAAPIGVYTSGKGSSAAGLTASVIKDSKGEFFLEGGAMVLADGGIICIDEFDKMREVDRVAIHEAMEQQTISIAKAGITTVLNCRTSVLAAANPVFGRYDDLKDVNENINLMTTILSRFDCIFIVRDVRDVNRDLEIARNVMNVHMGASVPKEDRSKTSPHEIPVEKLKRFINFCRARCTPRLNKEAAATLSSHYVHIRNQVRITLAETPGSSMRYFHTTFIDNTRRAIPITIRQLEAIVRLSESLAKMRLSNEATVTDVNEALRLFNISTLSASQVRPHQVGLGVVSSEATKNAEEFLLRRMGLQVSIGVKKIIDEACAQGYKKVNISSGIAKLIQSGVIKEYKGGKIIKRIK